MLSNRQYCAAGSGVSGYVVQRLLKETIEMCLLLIGELRQLRIHIKPTVQPAQLLPLFRQVSNGAVQAKLLHHQWVQILQQMTKMLLHGFTVSR